MYISGYNNGATIPSGYVTLKNCSTAIVYLSIINCLSKFDFNCPVFLTVLFILLYLSNSINQHENKILRYVFYLTVVTIVLDAIWFIANIKIKMKKYSNLEVNGSLELEMWNSQFGLHIMELILSSLICLFKIPFIYQCWQLSN
ncbi:unnamed protein product [Paramecium primaurelia]|uniref:Uncharacterized protein n=2 Tax=Paramecium TaxID=5884 RepID=A0A8S1RWJ8_9CILI|nr:unnamed protein product [Paramecium primaurelia]CAD8131780.1 unnamed protein product [Paramecium pentaurelia]